MYTVDNGFEEPDYYLDEKRSIPVDANGVNFPSAQWEGLGDNYLILPDFLNKTKLAAQRQLDGLPPALEIPEGFLSVYFLRNTGTPGPHCPSHIPGYLSGMTRPEPEQYSINNGIIGLCDSYGNMHVMFPKKSDTLESDQAIRQELNDLGYTRGYFGVGYGDYSSKMH